MAEFEDLQKRLQQSRTASVQARADAANARERLARLEAQLHSLDCAFDPKDRTQVAERQRLQAQIEAASASAKQTKEAAQIAAASETDAIGQFGAFTDPQKAIARMDDQFPILMMPVRLETRFQRNLQPPQLWVRVYPDDCSIDSFEDTLSENEIKNAKLYWSAIWAAGGNADQERGAWRGLAGSQGSGRAEWIIARHDPPYQPLNMAAKPAKANPDDVVLTIATEAPPSAAEQAALVIFWKAFWLADDDSAAVDAATATLATATDAGRAAQLIHDFQPFNITTKPASPKKKTDVAVSAAFVIFPKTDDLDLKRHPWSQAATAALMPDRFVFIGYNGTAQDLFAVGNPVTAPLAVSPDPSAAADQQLQQDKTTGELIIPSEMQWMVDFDQAVASGMGFRLNLTPGQAANGFDRVIVLGLRFSADRATAQKELETLIAHHRFGSHGFAIVPQGTPTNNTDTGSSGYSRTEDPDISFDELQKASLFAETTNWFDKRDGQWLAEYLGIDSAAVNKLQNSDGLDQGDVRAMNTALWPATLGYWMETMMGPVFSGNAVAATRDFFNRFVSGRGAIPAVRVGKQPYGILPATVFSRMSWLNSLQRDDSKALQSLYAVISAMYADWGKMVKDVSFAGKSGDPHQLLLDIVGLHSGSVEYAQRMAESAEQLFNRLTLEGLGGFLSAPIIAGLFQQGKELLVGLGYTGTEGPDMLKKFFFADHNALTGPLIDDRPLSESDPIRAYSSDDKQNYIQWLIAAAGTSIDALYSQQGFKDDKPPQALLYLMLRHALQLGYHDTSLRLHESAGLLSPVAVQTAKLDDPFIHIRQTAKPFESRYEVLYKTETAITGSPTMSVGDYIGKSMGTLVLARYLNGQVDALGHLQDASTARLERAFSEHIDCCSYRLDAWLLGLVHAQLAQMRNIAQNDSGAPQPTKKGLYLGAYALLEDLRPETGVLQPVRISDPAIAADFDEPKAPPLMHDTANEGYIHAPSLNHAVAAAVLRNGYIANATNANPNTMAVNISSERVRSALGILEGLRGGQSLGALLGYQFERALHDGHEDFGLELDQFIFKMRREFPLASNRMASTQDNADDLAIDSIEARNVIDGMTLVTHIRNTDQSTYPFGKTRLKRGTPAQEAAITLEAGQLLETYDAVADLAMAEGVYQAVLGNYDRVASTLDAYSKGNFPPEPMIAQTPFNGIGLTHRVGLHFPLGSPAVGPDDTPRSLGEPAVNKWLTTILPPLNTVSCMVDFRDKNNAATSTEVLLSDLGIQPLDVLQLLRDDQGSQSLTELDERITGAVAARARPDGPITIRYMDTNAAPVSIFELTPLARHLRRLLAAARPLKPTDLSLTNEAKRTDNAKASVEKQRIQNVMDMLTALRADLNIFADGLTTALADPVANRGAIIAQADNFIDRTAALFARAAAFAIPQSGWAFAYDFRTRAFSGVLKKAQDLADRWATRLTDSQTVIDQYDALPGTATSDERLALLTRAEHLISTQTVSPFPASLADYRTKISDKRDAFAAKRLEFVNITNTTRIKISLLLADAAACLPVDAFEFPALSIAAEEDMMIAITEDALSTTQVILRECDRRLAAAGELMAAPVASADAQVTAMDAAAKALLGSDFFIVPEFTLTAAQGAELASAVAASGSLLDYVTNTVKTPQPVDTWMYGVARVRERIRSWEQIVMLSGAFTGNEPDFTPLQLPVVAGDQWLALEFPPGAVINQERLLYTSHFAAPFDKSAKQCGLLLDEWSEIIPGPDTTTGVTFHYNRPGNEAPQSMLLLTPSAFRGAWQWADVVGAIYETLDLAKARAVEPVHVDTTPYAQFLPATVMAVTMRQLTISMNLALNNKLMAQVSPNV
jgi:hypothetical protein